MLSLEELSPIWAAAGEFGAYGAIVRLLILIGQRRDEVAELKRSEIDLAAAMISLPGARTKNGRPQDVPLSRQAAAAPRGAGGARRRRVFAPADAGTRVKARLAAMVQLENAVGAARPAALSRHWHGRAVASPRTGRGGSQPRQRPQGGHRGRLQPRGLCEREADGLQAWADHLLGVGVGKVVPLRR